MEIVRKLLISSSDSNMTTKQEITFYDSGFYGGGNPRAFRIFQSGHIPRLNFS